MKKILFIILTMGVLLGNLFSKTNTIDSLKTQYNNATNDTVKIKCLIKISNTFKVNYPDSSLYYANKLLAFAEEKQMLYYISDAYDLISNIYEQKGDLEKCIVTIDSAKHYASLIDDPIGVIFFTNNKAGIYIKMGRYFEALQSFEEVKSIGERINRPSSIVAALNNFGVVYHYLGDDKTSLDYFIQAYEMRLENNLTNKIAYSLNNIGAVYSKYGNYPEAIEYHKKAMQAAIEQEDNYNYLVALLNMGLDYDYIKDYKTSLKYYNKALIETKKQGDKTLQSHALERMSVVYTKQNDFQNAKQLLLKAYQISKEIGNQYDFASFSNSLGMIYLKEKNYKKSHALIIDALKIAKQINASKLEVEAYKSLTAYYYSVNNSDKAFHYQKLYDNMRDSLYNAETELKIANLKNRFELNQKLEELVQKEVELTSTKKISSERLTIIYIASIASIGFFILLIYILILYKKIKSKNKLIQQSEEKVVQLLKHEKELGKLKTRLISTVSHEFRTPMAIISSNAQLLRDYQSSMDEQMKNETLKFITSGVENMTSMMQNFEVLDKNTILEFIPKTVNLSEILTTIANGLQSLPKYTNRITISNQLTNNNFVVDKGLITHIVRNLLVNALKFSGDKIVNLTFNNTLNNIEITITDKGIGMSPADLAKVFENFHRGSNVENIKGTGVGMSVVKRCIDLHNGKIKIDSKEGRGTTIKVTLPYNKS